MRSASLRTVGRTCARKPLIRRLRRHLLPQGEKGAGGRLMFYREAGQFKTTYAADMALFPIRQDRYGLALILLVAFVVVPVCGNQFFLNTMMIPFLVLSLAGIGLNLLTG